MLQLTDLPDELLSGVFECISNDCPATFTSVSLTCKHLQRISTAFQWANVVLPWRLNKRSPMAKFIEMHQGDNRIRSIRLQPQRSVLNAFKVDMKNAHDHLQALYDTLSSLSRLTTFSIFLDDQVDSRCHLPGPVLARIVRSLPPSLLHLELDTECVDRISEHDHSRYGDDHLCVAISDRAPGLETLRLRLSCLCTDLFRSVSPTTPSKLRRAFIRLDTSPNMESHLAIDQQVGDCALPRRPNNNGRIHSHEGGHGAMRPEKIMRDLLDLRNSGALPALQRFVLWNWDPPGSPQAHCHVRDIATRSSTHYPKMTCSNLFQLGLPELEDTPWDSTFYVIRGNDGQDWIGGRKSLEKAMLHEVDWEEKSCGVRLPPSGPLREETKLCEEGLLSWDYVHGKVLRLQSQKDPRTSYLPEKGRFAESSAHVTKM